MAYPQVDLKGTDQAIKDIKALNKNLESMTKKKDKPGIKMAEKNLAKVVKDASKVVKAAIEGSEKNFKQHQKQIQAYFKACKDAMKASESALKKFQDNPMKTSDGDLAGYAEGYIKTIHGLAEQDADDYGKSWFKVRGFNNAGDIDKKLGKRFQQARRCADEQWQVRHAAGTADEVLAQRGQEPGGRSEAG